MKPHNASRALQFPPTGYRLSESSNNRKPHHGAPTSTDNELSVMGMLKYRAEASKEIQTFDQLEADDELAMEGPVMKNFGDYMTLKRSKIKRQYLMSEQLASQEQKATSMIFSGLTAFISTSIYMERSEHLSTSRQNTGIDFKYLSRLWLLHGGELTQNVASGKITHFVNSFLPIYFLRDIDKIRSKMRLVSPQWILDCVEQNKKLPTHPYDLQIVDAEGVARNDQLKIPFAFANNKPTASSSTSQAPVEPAQPPIFSAVMDVDTPATLQDQQVDIDDQADFNDDQDDYEEGQGGQRMRTSAENPNFVADYFASSRLHHLSSWKMKFQEELELHLMSLAQANESEQSPKKPRGVSGSFISSSMPSLNESDLEDDFEMVPEPMIVHIDMDCFFAAVSTRNRPDLKEKPVAISHGGKRALAASVNYAARAVGIHNGTRLSDAYQRCKDAGLELTVLGYDFPAYEQVSRLAHEIFLRYTPQLHIKSCDEAILDFTGIITSLEQVETTVAKIRAEVLQATGCTCSAGIGSSLTLSRFALKKAKPNGMATAPSWRNTTLTSGLESPLSRSVPRLMMSVRTGIVTQDAYHSSMTELMQKHATGASILDPDATHKRSSADAAPGAAVTLAGAHMDEGALEHEPAAAVNVNPAIFLAPFGLSSLPGVGWKTRPKFSPSVSTVGDVQKMSLMELRQLLGHKNGASLFLACRGIDAKPPPPISVSNRPGDRKTISVELSYGVRFHNYTQMSKFIVDVTEELQRRCQKANLVGKTATVKLWIRLPGTPPTTFLGHGPCSTASKSGTLHTPTADSAILAPLAEKLVMSFGLEAAEVRGFGLSLSHLSKPSSAASSSRSHSITKMFQAATSKQQQQQIQGANAGSQDPPSDLAPKKRLRTIDALMEKSLNKANNKKSKRSESSAKEKAEPHRVRGITKPSSTAVVIIDDQEEGEENGGRGNEGFSGPKSRSASPPVREIPVFQTSEPAFISTRVIAYRTLDAELLKKLDSWMTILANPEASHCELIHQFATTLVASRNLEDMISFAKKLIHASKSKINWIAVVKDVIELIQTGVKENYGFCLHLPAVPTATNVTRESL